MEPLIADVSKEDDINFLFEDKFVAAVDPFNFVSNYFSDIWFDSEFIQAKEIEKGLEIIPNSLNGWNIYGVSIHPLLGLSLSESRQNILKPNNFVLNINAPSITRIGEELIIEYNIIRFDAKKKVQFTVDIYEGVNKIFTGNLTMKANILSISENFAITTSDTDDDSIQIKIVARTTDVTDEAQKVIRIEKNNPKTEIIKVILPISNDQPDYLIKEDSFVQMYGNLLGPALKGLKNVV